LKVSAHGMYKNGSYVTDSVHKCRLNRKERKKEAAVMAFFKSL